jgi:hypothetical protein
VNKLAVFFKDKVLIKFVIHTYVRAEFWVKIANLFVENVLKIVTMTLGSPVGIILGLIQADCGPGEIPCHQSPTVGPDVWIKSI